MGWHDPLLQTEGEKGLRAQKEKETTQGPSSSSAQSTIPVSYTHTFVCNLIPNNIIILTLHSRQYFKDARKSNFSILLFIFSWVHLSLHNIQHELCFLFVHKLDCLLFKPQGYVRNLSGFYFWQSISSWLVRVPECMHLIAGTASGSLSFTGVSWKENKQAESSTVDEWGDTEWEWVWKWVRQRVRDTKNKKNY